jgi:hypothetical protein
LILFQQVLRHKIRHLLGIHDAGGPGATLVNLVKLGNLVLDPAASNVARAELSFAGAVSFHGRSIFLLRWKRWIIVVLAVSFDIK